MAKLSPARLSVPIIPGIELVGRGKARDSYRLNPEMRFIFVTDGISVYDFSLNMLVRNKGWMLNILSHNAFKHLEKEGYPTHMIAAGEAVDEYLPRHLRRNPLYQRQGMVVWDLDMVPDTEFVGRYCLAGSVLSEYMEHGTIYGKPMPPGLQEGDMLPEPLPLFTPTTKAEEGPDLKKSPEEVREQSPEATEMFHGSSRSLQPFVQSKGLLMLDEKGEFGRRKKDRKLMIGDERGTCDSSRFVLLKPWKESRKAEKRQMPDPHDKQIVRNEAKKYGVNKLNSKDPADIARVQAIEFSEEICEATTRRYEDVVHMMTGGVPEAYSFT